MKPYEQIIQEFGYEIADDSIKKEQDHTYVVMINREKVTNSLIKIYNHKDPRQIVNDLADSIKKEAKTIREKLKLV